MFIPFSRGYYLGQFVVEPHEGEYGLMQTSQHEQVNEQLYASDTGIERLDYPLVMKLERQHFPVYGEGSIPTNTLKVPEAILRELDVNRLSAVREVLLAKADAAVELIRYAEIE